MLAVQALAPSLTDLTTHRASLADLDGIGGLAGLRHLQLYLEPGDSVMPVGRLTGLVRLRIGGRRVTGWPALAACEMLEEAQLDGLTGANLRQFAGWTRPRRLTLNGRGPRSLAGIEKLAALEELELRMLGTENLSPLAALSRLRSLRLIAVKATYDLTPLAGLEGLQRLEVSRAGIAAADVVHVGSVRPLAGLDQLEEVVLSGTVVDDGDLMPVAALPRLRRLVVYGAAGPTVEELRARPDLDFIAMPGPGMPAAVTPLVIRPASDGTWYLRGDLTERLGVDTNYDAEKAVRKAVTSRDRELVRRLSFDTEAGAVEISAADQADLHTVATIIESLS
jgi:hypothetical protein